MTDSLTEGFSNKARAVLDGMKEGTSYYKILNEPELEATILTDLSEFYSEFEPSEIDDEDIQVFSVVKAKEWQESGLIKIDPDHPMYRPVERSSDYSRYDNE